jgi:hypothetical protein
LLGSVRDGRYTAAEDESVAVEPSLESVMLRNSVGSMESHRPTCASCGRTPLVGEFLYRLDAERMLCGLCLEQVPESDRLAIASERIHAGERGIRVAPRAA